METIIPFAAAGLLAVAGLTALRGWTVVERNRQRARRRGGYIR